MTTLINKESTQHYANKMVLAENRKVGSKSLPTALNEIDALIDEMKTYFDAEYGSALDMKLKNNENIFSVGAGIDIDKRNEVENSFTDVELSGNSLVNLCVTDVGRLHFVADGTPNIKHYKTTAIKPNTKYTIITNVLKNTINNNLGIIGWNITDDNRQVIIPREYVGLFKSCFTTNNEIQEVWPLDFWRENTIGEIVIENIIILEGDWTNKPVPQYFQGLKSVGEKEDGNHKISILSVGKNLWDGTFEIGSIDTNNGKDTANGVNRKRSMYIPIKGGKTISVNQFDYIDDSHKIFVHQYDENKNAVLRSPALYVAVTSSITFSLENSTRFIRFRTENERDLKPNSVQIKYGESSTNYEPYKSDKKEISLNEPLRGLPNGIKDTIEKVNGKWKIVRRCVEATLDGSETSWNRNTDFNGTEVLFFYINTKHSTSLPEGATKSNGNTVHIQCDSFPCYALKDRVNNKNNNIEAIIYSDSTNPLIQFHINKSKLTSEDVTGFKQWLSQNPTKVIYELATPIIEDISPITLQC